MFTIALRTTSAEVVAENLTSSCFRYYFTVSGLSPRFTAICGVVRPMATSCRMDISRRVSLMLFSVVSFRRRGVHRCNGDLSPHNSWLKRGRKPHRYRLQAQCRVIGQLPTRQDPRTMMTSGTKIFRRRRNMPLKRWTTAPHSKGIRSCEK